MLHIPPSCLEDDPSSTDRCEEGPWNEAKRVEVATIDDPANQIKTTCRGKCLDEGGGWGEHCHSVNLRKGGERESSKNGTRRRESLDTGSAALHFNHRLDGGMPCIRGARHMDASAGSKVGVMHLGYRQPYGFVVQVVRPFGFEGVRPICNLSLREAQV